MFSYSSEVSEDFKFKILFWWGRLGLVEDPWVKFMFAWIIFDAYLTEISQKDTDNQKLTYFFGKPNDFKTKTIADWKGLIMKRLALQKLSPVHDMRHGSNQIVEIEDDNNFEQIFRFVYQIRCNLFHGAKNLKNSRDHELVKAGGNFLIACINSWLNT